MAKSSHRESTEDDAQSRQWYLAMVSSANTAVHIRTLEAELDEALVHYSGNRGRRSSIAAREGALSSLEH